jgi:hypothetical protein
MKAYGVADVILLFLTSELDAVICKVYTPPALVPAEVPLVPIWYEAAWASVPVWTLFTCRRRKFLPLPVIEPLFLGHMK